MKTTRHRAGAAAVLCCLLAGAGHAPAGDTPAPDPRALSVFPAALELRGRLDAAQLVVTTPAADADSRDVTGETSYVAADPKVVRVSPAGRVLGLTAGDTTVAARFGDASVTIPVRVRSSDALPVTFRDDVGPALLRLGCYAAACHGGGADNPLRLSPFASDPRADHDRIAHDGRGRYVLPAGPEFSLLLLKATGAVPHAGGERVAVGSEHYNLLRRWVKLGAPFGAEPNPVTQLSVHPVRRTLNPGGRQQLVVLAHDDAGAVRDVTRLATYQSDDPGTVGVDGTGLVSAFDIPGSAAVVIRYRDRTTAFHAVVPANRPAADDEYRPRNLVDELTHQRWRQLGLEPTEACSDETFLRRVTLHLTGQVPTPEEIRAFSDDRGPERRDRVIDRLLASPGYAIHWANWWSDALRLPQVRQPSQSPEALAFYNWLRESFARDVPFDRFAGDLLEASGDVYSRPAAHWYYARPRAEQLAEDTALALLGFRLDCLKCHPHPHTDWAAEDARGLATFFRRVQLKKAKVSPRLHPRRHTSAPAVAHDPSPYRTDPSTGKPLLHHWPGGVPFRLAPAEDPRHVLMGWVQETEQHYFARALVNRYWAHLFGQPLVTDADEWTADRPGGFDDWLDALTADFVKNGYSRRRLLRDLCRSRAYQLGAGPGATGVTSRHQFSRYVPHPLPPDELAGVVAQILNLPTKVRDLPADQPALRQASIFRADRLRSGPFAPAAPAEPGQCLRREVTLAPAPGAFLKEFLASDEVREGMRQRESRVESLYRDRRPEADRATEVFLWALGRPPTDAQREGAARFLRDSDDKRAALTQLFVALLSTREFAYVE